MIKKQTKDDLEREERVDISFREKKKRLQKRLCRPLPPQPVVNPQQNKAQYSNVAIESHHRRGCLRQLQMRNRHIRQPSLHGVKEVTRYPANEYHDDSNQRNEASALSSLLLPRRFQAYLLHHPKREIRRQTSRLPPSNRLLEGVSSIFLCFHRYFLFINTYNFLRVRCRRTFTFERVRFSISPTSSIDFSS